jgi:predicted enzyme related to lactoylglutathione lyase
MNTDATPAIRTIIYPVKDIAGAKAMYTSLLGVEPMMDEAYYVGYSVSGQDVGLDPNGHSKGMTGPVTYWDVHDIRASVQTLLDGGAVEKDAVQDVGEGKLVATLTDVDGNQIGLIQRK